MKYEQFLEEIINGGIEGCKQDYSGPNDKDRLEGSIAGFEACRGKNPQQLFEEYSKASKLAEEAFSLLVENYWYFRCFQMEVEWVCNVVSAGTKIQLLSWLPTTAGVMRAGKILGVRQMSN